MIEFPNNSMTPEDVVVKYERLVWKFVNQVPYDLQNDAYQNGMQALINCIKTFNPEKGSFMTYAFYHVQKAVKFNYQQYKENGQAIQTDSIDEILDGLASRRRLGSAFGEGNDYNLIGSSKEKYFAVKNRLDEKIAMKQAMLYLNKTERFVITRYYYYGYDTTEIGEMLGISRQRVHQIEKSALAKMRYPLMGD